MNDDRPIASVRPQRESDPGEGRRHRPRLAGLLPAAALAAGLLLAPPAARGQPAPADSLPAGDTVAVEDLVVTVYRVPYARDAVTSDVTVIRGEEIRAAGLEHVHEALRSVTGSHVVQTGGFGGPTSLFMRGGESDYVKVLVDGVPVNQPGGTVDLGNLTADNIERIEVVRGPVSVLYGSDAVTGVVQIFTERGSGDPRAEVSVDGGTFGTVSWDASYAGGSETADYAFSVSRFISDGVYDLNNDYGNTVASGRVVLTPDDRTRADLSVRYTDSRYDFPTDFAGRAVDANQFRKDEATLLGLDLSRRFGGGWEAEVDVSSSDLNRGFDDAPDSPGDTTGFFAFKSLEDVSRKSVDGRLNYHLTPSTVFTVGGEVEGQSERSFSRSRSQFGDSESSMDVDRTTRAGYAQAVGRPVRPLTVSVGLRVDDSDTFGTFETYRAGATYRLPTGTRVRASYGTGFKEPTFFENFAEGFFRGNPDLEPEESESWEVAVDQELLGDRLTVGGTFFDQGFEDLIQFTSSPPGERQVNFFNVARADASGVEARAEARLLPSLAVEANYTYLDTEVVDSGFQEGPDASVVEGERLLRRPTHAGGATLSYRAGGRGAVRLNLNVVGERTDRDFSAVPAERVSLDAYALVNVSASYRLFGGRSGIPGFRPTLRVDNLLDEDYREVANFRTRGRTIFVGGRFDMDL